MISLKKYLESETGGLASHAQPEKRDILTVTMDAYRSALRRWAVAAWKLVRLWWGLKLSLDALSEGSRPA